MKLKTALAARTACPSIGIAPILGSRTLCTYMLPFGGIKLKVGVTTAYPC